MVAKKGRGRGMESGVAFTKAVKHLFKHLHDARALSRNLLVRHIFDDTSIAGTGASRDRAVLSRILQLIRQGADYCRDADLMAGNRERGLRQHAILTLQYLEKQPIQRVASELGISQNYCYRERADICGRVALYVCEHQDPPTADYLGELDDFRVLLDSVVRGAKSHDKKRTLSDCGDLVNSAPTTQNKVEALCAVAGLSLDFEEPKRASTAISSASALCDKHGSEDPSAPWVVTRARVNLMGAKLANYGANTSQASQLAGEAVLALRGIKAGSAFLIRELFTESLYELGAALWNAGDLRRGYDFMAEAEANLPHVRATSFELRTQIMGTIWRMRNRLLMDPEVWHPLWQRIRGLADTFEIAYGCGLTFQAADALVSLVELHVFAGKDSDALRAGQLAVSLARQLPAMNLQAKILLDVAARLRRTPHWEYAMSLVSAAEELGANEAYYTEYMSCLAIERALLLKNFDDAWAMATAAGSEGAFADLRIRRRTVAAIAAHKLGRKREARVLIQRTIRECEARGDAALLADAYSVGADVTGDARLKRRAKAVAKLLTA